MIEFILGDRNSIVNIVTVLQTEQSEVRITIVASYVSLL